MRLGGAKGSLTLSAVVEHRMALAGMQKRKTLQSMAVSHFGQRGCLVR
jgi:hypothetical protein